MYICTSISRAQSEYTKWRKMRRYMLLNEPSSLRGKEDMGVTLLTGCGINLWLQPHVSSPVHIEELPSVQKWDEETANTHMNTCRRRHSTAVPELLTQTGLCSYWAGERMPFKQSAFLLARNICCAVERWSYAGPSYTADNIVKSLLGFATNRRPIAGW